MTRYTPTRHAAPMLPSAPRRGFDATRGLSAMLLGAMVSALIVVADQLIATWADGHLMLAWIALWVVAFSALALFGGSAHKVAVAAVAALDAWSERLARTRSDKRLWRLAQTNPRLMADLRAATGRTNR